MESKPIISLDDFRFTCFGREDELKTLLRDISYSAGKSTRQLLRLEAWWGTGKSTYLYNLCYLVNRSLFFGDDLENASTGLFRHVLGIYEDGPVRRVNLLEYTYENGLPVPWGPSLPKDAAERMRKDLWLQCVRKLSFLLLRKALYEIREKKLESEAMGGSALLKELHEKMTKLSDLKTGQFIEELDKIHAGDDRTYGEVGELLRYYMRMLMTSIEERTGVRKVVRQDEFEEEFPKLLYPTASAVFLVAYRKLFGSPETNLRRFTAIEKILKNMDTFALVVVDEVEDWTRVIAQKVDFDLHDIAADAESRISLAMIFRTEVLKNIRSAPALARYTTITDRFRNISLTTPEAQEIKTIAEGVFGTVRAEKADIFPCTPEFIQTLSERTRWAGSFNVRRYVGSLIEILEASLQWDRDDVHLTKEMLDLEESKSIVARVLKNEEERAKTFKPPSEILEE